MDTYVFPANSWYSPDPLRTQVPASSGIYIVSMHVEILGTDNAAIAATFLNSTTCGSDTNRVIGNVNGFIPWISYTDVLYLEGDSYLYPKFYTNGTDIRIQAFNLRGIRIW